MALPSAAPKDRPNAEIPEHTERTASVDLLSAVKRKASGLLHGEIHIIFVNGIPTRIVRIESELLR